LNTAHTKPVFLSIALIIALGFLAYGNSFQNEFIWDDEFLIEKNHYIKSIAFIPQVFSSDLGAGSEKEYGFYRPMQTVSYMADHFLWKLNVKGYHLTNILLHILVAAAIYWLIKVLFADNLLALLVGCFYVVHPIHTEAVTYIAGRADLLAFLFMLLCFLLYLKNCAAKNIGIYFLMFLSYACALFSKESSLILPALLLLYHYSFKKRFEAKAFFSLVGLAIVFVVMRFTFLAALLKGEAHLTTFLQRLPGFFMAIANYVQLLFLPVSPFLYIDGRD